MELHHIRKVWKNLRRLKRGGGVDQRLARMIGMYGIGENALARMEGIGAFRWKRLGGLAARACFGFRTLHQRKIFDRAGPGELRVLEGGKVARGCGEPRGRHNDKNDVPEGSGNNGAAWNAAL